MNTHDIDVLTGMFLMGALIFCLYNIRDFPRTIYEIITDIEDEAEEERREAA